MTKEEIKQKFFDVISAKLNYSMKIDEMKDLAEAFKTVCELDEKYCDVIIQRWENLTGGKLYACQKSKRRLQIRQQRQSL